MNRNLNSVLVTALRIWRRRALVGLGLLGSLLTGLGPRATEPDWGQLSPESMAHILTLREGLPAAPELSAEDRAGDPMSLAPAPPAPLAVKPALKADTLTSMESLDDGYLLSEGDIVSLRIVEDREESTPLLVTDAGDLDVPYIGRVPAKGKTCRQLAGEIKPLLEAEYYYHATVILAIDRFSETRGRVYVTGEVRMNGAVQIPGDEVFTVADAILMAGGFSLRADQRKVRILRRSPDGRAIPQTLVVNVAQVLNQGRLEQDVELKPGDVVVVPRKFLNF